MKNYREVADSVFARREQYQTEQKKNRKRLACAVTPLCLAALLGFGVWQSGAFNSRPAVGDLHEIASTPIETTAATTKLETTAPPVSSTTKGSSGDDADQIGIIIYEGKTYIQDCRVEINSRDEVALRDDLGDITAFDGFYKDGGVGGRLYTVKDNPHALCAALDNGAYILLIDNYYELRGDK